MTPNQKLKEITVHKKAGLLPSMNRRKLMVGAASMVGAGILLPGLSVAKSGAPIRLIIPYPVGGSTDIAGRMLGNSIAKTLGRTVVPDNKGGAAGLIGMQELLRAPADDSTLAISGIGTTVLLGLTKKDVPYVARRDLDFIAHLGSFGNLIVTRPDAPYGNLQELIDLAREKPGQITFGTPPVGSPSSITLAYLSLEAGIEVLDVPYQGHTQILSDVMGGQLDVGLVSVPQALELVRTGTLKALAATSAERSAALPDVPAVAETTGLEGFEAALWNVLVANKGTSPEMLKTLNELTNEAFSGADVQAQLKLHSIEFKPHTLDEVNAFVQAEQAKWERIVNAAGIRPN